jgi:hypothetical protein
MPIVRGQTYDPADDWHTIVKKRVETKEQADHMADVMKKSGLYDRVLVKESNEYIAPSDFDKKGRPMKYRNQMDKKRRGVGASTKVRPETVVIKSSATGKVYGRRTIVTKTTEGETMMLLPTLLNTITEAQDITTLPSAIIAELKKLMRKGASDYEQQWANALELVHKAYQVANVRRPAPNQKGAWKQYEELISFGVKELNRNRGLDGKWRMTSSVIREGSMSPAAKPLSKKRFFADIPGAGAIEIDGESLDQIMEKIGNLWRSRGMRMRIEERLKKHAILTMWDKENVQHDRIVVKEIS